MEFRLVVLRTVEVQVVASTVLAGLAGALWAGKVAMGASTEFAGSAWRLQVIL